MKNKRFIYILIPVAAIIWGLIIIKIIKSTRKKTVSGTEKFDSLPISNLIEKKDTISLIANYSDPFLKKSIVLQTSSNHFPRETRINTKPGFRRRLRKPAWPQISYGGLIESHGDEKMVALISVNNKKYLRKSGESINNLVIQQIYRDSIKVTYKLEDRVILR